MDSKNSAHTRRKEKCKMILDELNGYSVTSIKTNSGSMEFGVPKKVIDEGRLFRIADLYVIWKSTVVSCKEKDGIVEIEHKDGEKIVLKVRKR